ncbi:MAG: hypothetical protein NTX50_27275 [Candidatus Sumerlaeota bacterium]|nr:hypothetical protein [Candidatus Sumerlaeota bacterium]
MSDSAGKITGFAGVLCLGFFLLVLCGATVACKYFTKSAKPSALIADRDLPRNLGAVLAPMLPPRYRFLVRSERWNHDSANGRFERSFDCTVLQDNNAPVDANMVSGPLEQWIGKLVKVIPEADDTSRTQTLSRLVRYTDNRITGELRYAIKPVGSATLKVEDNQTTGIFLDVQIHIVEQKKR